MQERFDSTAWTGETNERQSVPANSPEGRRRVGSIAARLGFILVLAGLVGLMAEEERFFGVATIVIGVLVIVGGLVWKRIAR